MSTTLDVYCDKKLIVIKLHLFTPAKGETAFTKKELSQLEARFNDVFNGPGAPKKYLFKYGECQIKFQLVIRRGKKGKPFESDLVKVGPQPKGGGVTIGPKAPHKRKTIGIAPKPDGSFDWDTGVDELGHGLGIKDPKGRTWFWKGRGGKGKVSSKHVKQILESGEGPSKDKKKWVKWLDKIDCCTPEGVEKKVSRMSAAEEKRLRDAAKKRKKKKAIEKQKKRDKKINDELRKLLEGRGRR